MPLNKGHFKKINLYTIIAVYLLILVGGIVRNTGAGMGCPDWPKCFGSYIPPSSIASLPDNYEDIYVAKRIQKNERLASVLNGLGMSSLADQVLDDPNTSLNTTFDVKKAWIEYANRLVGVLIGLFVVLNLIYSFLTPLTSVRVLGVLSFILVVFQGWVGSLVVSTNLLPGFISFHMVLALLLVALLLVQQFKVGDNKTEFKGNVIIAVLLVLFFVQIVLGTQVREEIDSLHFLGLEKDSWMGHLGSLFYVHRSYSLILCGLIGYIGYINRSMIRHPLLIGLLLLVLLEILLGIAMAYLNFPVFTQPAHLFVGTLAFGVIFYLFLNSNFKSSIR